MKRFACIAINALGIGIAYPATDVWEMAPLHYSATDSTDPIAKLAKDDSNLTGATSLDQLRCVLDLLQIPEASQMLVFSKTSKQNSLIHPGNPRCLFFNENSYVGYVPGGDIEVITHDQLLGSVYYVIEPGGPDRPAHISRDNSECMSCHGTTRTE